MKKFSNRHNVKRTTRVTLLLLMLAAPTISQSLIPLGPRLLPAELPSLAIPREPSSSEASRLGLSTHECFLKQSLQQNLPPIPDVINIYGCYDESSFTYYNAYSLRVSPGVRIRFTIASSAFTIWSQVQLGNSVLAYGTARGTLTYEHAFNAASEETYVVFVSTTERLATGNYTIGAVAVYGSPPPPPPPPPPPTANCVITATNACLAAGRFRVSVTWRSPTGSGVGTSAHITADTAYFWFFNSANVELVVKVLDARTINGRFWVFYGALSDVEYTITITDTERGLVKTYFNPQSQLASVADTSAF